MFFTHVSLILLLVGGYGHGGPLTISPPNIVFPGMHLFVEATQKLGIPFVKDYQLGNNQGKIVDVLYTYVYIYHIC